MAVASICCIKHTIEPFTSVLFHQPYSLWELLLDLQILYLYSSQGSRHIDIRPVNNNIRDKGVIKMLVSNQNVNRKGFIVQIQDVSEGYL